MNAGPLRFARFATPPNRLGYCGPLDGGELWQTATGGGSADELAHLAAAFDGAFPYLELIAGANHIEDPLDERVVDAYWIGNRLLENIDMAEMGWSVDDRFRKRAGAGWEGLSSAVVAGGAPHHSFHVLCVYPWVGLLRDGSVDEPLQVINKCRIRVARVGALFDETASVTSRQLHWNGHLLRRGAAVTEDVRWAIEGATHVPDLEVGDLVAIHWDWICERLSPAQASRLVAWTNRHLEVVAQASPLLI